MARRLAWLCSLFAIQALAMDITPDFKALTDFRATYAVNMENVLKEASKHEEVPYSKASEMGTIQLDLANEKLRFHSRGSADFASNPSLPPPLWGVHAAAGGEMVIDGEAGFAAFRMRGFATGQMGKLGSLEMCVKVGVPAGVFPPKEAIQPMLQQAEAGLDAKFAQLPLSGETTIDGEQVAMMQQKMGPQDSDAPTAYVALRENGAPYGAGIVPPKDGKWNPFIKFPTWKVGAGQIREFSCAAGASTSAAVLVTHPQGMKALELFDDLIARMRSSHPLAESLKMFPQQPSMLFRDAAAMELNAAGSTQGEDAHYLPMLLVAGAAGAIGAFVALGFMKMTRLWSASPQNEALLYYIA